MLNRQYWARCPNPVIQAVANRIAAYARIWENLPPENLLAANPLS